MEKESIVTHLSIQRGMIYRNIFVVILKIFVVLSTIWISFLQFQLPEVLPVKGKSDQFSAERAMNYLNEFAVKPHPIGSQDHDRVRDYLVRTLSKLGVAPEIQSTDGVISEWGAVYKGKVENIVVRIPGKNSSKAIMISAHYDSVPGGPGASDDGSGVAAILETVRALTKSQPLKNDIIILLTDGEENGLLGAKAFVEHNPWAKDVGVAFNFDARGNTGPSILFETSDGNERLVSEFIKAVPNPVAHSFLYDIYKKMPNETDLTVFKQAGMYGMNFGLIEGLYSYHTPEDKIANMNLNSLQQTGDSMIHLVKHFGDMDLVSKKDGNIVFFNLFGNKVVMYSENLVIPLMILLIFVYMISFVHGYKLKKLTLKGISAGFLFFIATVILALYSGKGLWSLISIILPKYIWAIETDLKISNPIFAGFTFVLFVFIVLIYQLVAKKIKRHNLIMGAYFGWLVLTVVASFYFKESRFGVCINHLEKFKCSVGTCFDGGSFYNPYI